MGDLQASVVHHVDKQELPASEYKELSEQLRLAHLRGDLLTTTFKQGWGRLPDHTPVLARNRRPGRKQWSTCIGYREIECQLKARQSYEQQSGVAN